MLTIYLLGDINDINGWVPGFFFVNNICLKKGRIKKDQILHLGFTSS